MVKKPKWLIVARNEYRIRTSFIRRIRSSFLFLAGGSLVVYVAFIAPFIVRVLIDDFIAFLLSQAAVAMVQIILFLIFFYFMILPITTTLREQHRGQLEIFLSAPVKPSDVLLGTFLGAVPLYAISIVIITGIFTALLNPLELSTIQITMIIIVFVVIFLSAFWIGIVIAALLRTRLGKTARGRDIGRALAMLLALPLVAMVYAIGYGGLLNALADPGNSGMVKTILGWLPSSWGAEVIVQFASHPGSVAAAGFEPVVRFCGLILFFVAALFTGSKVASRAYSLEPTTFISARANPDGIFYKTVRYFGGGGSFGTLVVSLFKDYSRRLENISGITYMLGILSLMIIFLAPQSYGPDEPPVALLSTMIIFPIIVVMVTGGVTVQGKHCLFIYRKAPSGEGRVVKAMLLKSWLMAVPIAGGATAVITVVSSQWTLLSLVITTGLMMLFVAAWVVFVLGLFLVNPAFSEKSIKLWINVMIAMFGSIGLFLLSLLILTKGGQLTEPIGGMVSIQLVHQALAWLVGVMVLLVGKKRLSSIE